MISRQNPENLDELIDNLQDLAIYVDQQSKKVKVTVLCE